MENLNVLVLVIRFTALELALQGYTFICEEMNYKISGLKRHLSLISYRRNGVTKRLSSKPT